MFEIENEFLKHSEINGILVERGLKVKFYWIFKAFLAFLLQHPHFTGVMTEIHWHSTGNFDEDLKAYFGHLHDRNSWYKHKVKKYLGKKGMDLFQNIHIKFWSKCEFDSPYHLVAPAHVDPLLCSKWNWKCSNLYNFKNSKIKVRIELRFD